MRILITGGCGFIGSYIAQRFFKEGHQIFITDSPSSGSVSNVVDLYKVVTLSRRGIIFG